MRVLRYEVPIDDNHHTHELRGPVLYVDQRAFETVEFWALEMEKEMSRSINFQVFGTGHEVPKGSLYIGTSMSPALVEQAPTMGMGSHLHYSRGRLVWHLFAVSPLCRNHVPVQHRDGKEPWCHACGLSRTFQQP